MAAERTETNNQQRARRLIAIANDLLAMARDLELAGASVDPDIEQLRTGRSTFAQETGDDHPILAELARQAYRDRRLRDDIFPSRELFGEPAWDMMLDLFIAAKERRRVSVTSACIGAAVPSTTALRWISILEEKGLVQREADTIDARRIFVRLTASGYSSLVRYFSKAARPVYLLDSPQSRTRKPKTDCEQSSASA